MSSTVKELQPSWNGKVAFVSLVLNIDEEKELAVKLGAATATTLVFIGRDGKVKEVIRGIQEKKAIEEKISALLK